MTAAPYADLLTAPADRQVGLRVYLDPIEVLKLVKRIRKVSFFLRIEMNLWTQFNEDGRATHCYDVPDSISVSAAQVESILKKKAQFNKMKADREQMTGKVEVTRLGDCLFFG